MKPQFEMLSRKRKLKKGAKKDPDTRAPDSVLLQPNGFNRFMWNPAAMVYLQRKIGNHAIGNLWRSISGAPVIRRSPNKSATLQRDIRLPEITIYGDPEFYSRARRRNRYWANHPPQPGWPYTESLRRLWEEARYDEFAEAIREYQTDTMGQALDDADGILGPNTARALAEGAHEERPAEDAETVESESESADEGETTESAAPTFAAVPADVMERATGSPWYYHESVYNRFQQEGRDLGIDGLASTWQGYLAQMGVTTFLGRQVAGHQALLTRLERAEAYLRREHPDLSDRELLPRIGQVGSRSQWRAGESTTSYHVFGLALDIDAGRNPWITSSSGSRRQEWTIWRAAWLIGGGVQSVWSERSHQWATEDNLTTEEIHGRYQRASEAVAEYLALLENEEQLAARIAALGEPPAGPSHEYLPRTPTRETLRNGGAGEWQNVIRQDRQNWPAAARETGFMNLRLELVQALRDEAGLSWGACDLGRRESGDFMHFDLRSPQFERLRNQIRTPMQTDLRAFQQQIDEALPGAVQQ